MLVDLAEMKKWKYLVTINLSKVENDLILMPTRNTRFKSVDQINNFVHGLDKLLQHTMALCDLSYSSSSTVCLF